MIHTAISELTKDTADEGRDEGDTSLSAGNGLGEAEEEGEVAVDALLLESAGSLDTLVGGGNLDEDALLVNAELLVLGNEGVSLGLGGLGVEGEAGVDLGGDTAGDDLEDLTAEEDEELVAGDVELLVLVATLLLGVGNGLVDEDGVVGVLDSGQDQRGVLQGR